MSQTVFRTNSIGEYLGSYSTPNNSYLPKASETFNPPPSTNTGEVALLNKLTGQWDVVEDNRGTTYYSSNGKSTTITAPGVGIPEGAILTAPETRYHDKWDYAKGEWIFNYDKCRNDLYEQIEEQKRHWQRQGILINGVLWDNDLRAEVRLTQIGLVLLKNPNFYTEDFYPNADTIIRMDASVHSGWMLATQLQLQKLFGWRTESRAEIAETTNTKQLMRYFDTLEFIPSHYNADGTPQEG